MTQALLNTASRSTPFSMPLIRAMDWSSDSLEESRRWMSGSRCSAAAVMVTPALVRVNSGKPHSASIVATEWLMAEGVRCSCSAARAKLPSWAMVEKIWQASSVIKSLRENARPASAAHMNIFHLINEKIEFYLLLILY